MLKYYSIDPVDVNLIINEQATYLSTNLKDVRKIMSVTSFLDEVDEIFEKEQDIRRGTIKTSKDSQGPSDIPQPNSGMFKTSHPSLPGFHNQGGTKSSYKESNANDVVKHDNMKQILKAEREE
jgi:hypothetical protein